MTVFVSCVNNSIVNLEIKGLRTTYFAPMRLSRGRVQHAVYSIAAVAFFHLHCLSVARAADTTSMRFDPWVAAGGYAATYSVSKADRDWFDFSNSGADNGIGLNILAAGVKAESAGLFGAITLQYGDVPLSGWDDSDLDLFWLQDAWIGYHISEQLDVQVGAFLSPFGVETPIGFENFSGIMSIPGFFDPACHSGVQVTWNMNADMALIGGIVSSFSNFSLAADLPSLLASWQYTPEDDQLLVQAIVSNQESDLGQFYQLYTSLAGMINMERTHMEAELNAAFTSEVAAQPFAAMVTSMAAAYYDILPSWQTGIRVEAIYDPSGVSTAFRAVDELPYNTLMAAGLTASVTYQPTEWSKIRVDARYLGSLDANSRIEAAPDARERTEILLCTDVMLPLR